MAVLDDAVNLFNNAQRSRANLQPPDPLTIPAKRGEEVVALGSQSRQGPMDLVSQYPALVHFFHILALFLSMILPPDTTSATSKDAPGKEMRLPVAGQQGDTAVKECPGGWPQSSS